MNLSFSEFLSGRGFDTSSMSAGMPWTVWPHMTSALADTLMLMVIADISDARIMRSPSIVSRDMWHVLSCVKV